MKRDYLKELWVNRPWVYIPDVVKFMKKYPYRKEREYFWNWLWDTLSVCWMYVWKY